MKYLLLTLSLLITLVNAQQENLCFNSDGKLKIYLYSPTVMDLAKDHTVTFGKCADIGLGADNITGYRVHYKEFPNKVIYIDLDLSSGLDFLGTRYQEIIRQIDVRSVLGHHFTDSNVKLIFRSKNEDSDALGVNDYQLMKAFDLTIVNSVANKTPITDPTGAWFDPALNGVGFVLMQVENGSVMYYYGYDDAGKRLWLLSEVIDETWIKGEAKTLVMYEGKADANTNFTTPPGTAPGTVEWGKVEMRFDDCSSGFAKLSGADGEQTFTLTKLAVPGAVHCTIQ